MSNAYQKLDDFNKKLLDNDRFELLVFDRGTNMVHEPAITHVTVEMPRSGSPSTLKLTAVQDGEGKIDLGNIVRFKIDGELFWYGYVFTIEDTEDRELEVTCYDQLRYLKNKDTYRYDDIAYSELLKLICADQELLIGEIEDTGIKIDGRIEEDKEYFEILQTASDLTTSMTGRIYNLYDKAGKICLTQSSGMRVEDVIVHEEAGQNFSYSTSIDENTFNSIKVDVVDHATDTVESVVAEDDATMETWGKLGWYDRTTETIEQVERKTKALLELLNRPTRAISFNKVWGHKDVRGGSEIPVQISLRDIEIDGYMLVDDATHTFEQGNWYMDLKCLNGDFSPKFETDDLFIYEDPRSQYNSEGTIASYGGMIGDTIQEQIWSFFKGKGYSNASISAIMGNMAIESQFKLDALGDGGTSYGLLQWHAERWDNLKNWCKDKGYSWQSLEGQLNFAHYELQTSYNGKYFMQLTDINYATDWFTTNVESPKEATARRPERKKFANQFYNQFKDWNPRPALAPGSKRQQFISYVTAQKGKPYSQNANLRMTSHFDCSSLVLRGIRAIGLDTTGNNLSTGAIPNDSRLQRISRDQLQPGDLLTSPGHVVIYLGNDQIFEAKSPGKPAGYGRFSTRKWDGYYRIKGIDG